MANYNTFIVQETKGGKPLLVTSSVRKARKLLTPGIRVDVWNNNQRVETVYYRTIRNLDPYVTAEKEYIRNKQAAAERKNNLRRAKRGITARQDSGCRPW